MKERSLTIPEIALIGGTRVALGAGIGLLLSERLGKDARRGAGWALFGVGIVTTIPLALAILGRRPVSGQPVSAAG
jgi:hypothetical protein